MLSRISAVSPCRPMPFCDGGKRKAILFVLPANSPFFRLAVNLMFVLFQMRDIENTYKAMVSCIYQSISVFLGVVHSLLHDSNFDSYVLCIYCWDGACFRYIDGWSFRARVSPIL